MKIKRAEIVESNLDEVDGEIIVKSTLILEVEDESRTIYLTEIDIPSPPILTWEVLDAKEKERQIKQSLKGRSF
jgi:hypothetical protein